MVVLSFKHLLLIMISLIDAVGASTQNLSGILINPAEYTQVRTTSPFQWV